MARKPAPFKRPSVSISTGGPVRTWGTRFVSSLLPGDMIAGMGQIAQVTHQLFGSTLVMVSGDTVYYGADDYVTSFSDAPEDSVAVRE